MNEKVRNVLGQQKKLFYTIVCGFLLVLLAISFSFTSSDSSKTLSESRKIDLPTDKIEPQDIWMTRVEEGNRLLDQKIKYIEDMMLASKKEDDLLVQENNNIKQELASLRVEMKQNIDIKQVKPEVIKITPKTSETINSASFFSDMPPPANLIKAPIIEICSEQVKRKVSHVDFSIPAGTSVKALLISSIDAPCSVLSTSDPQPVKLRILDDGHLPNHVKVKLKGGIIIASVYGDLSSERVYMRIERLTQVKPNGEFIETSVAGYVTGEDGKYGVRGIVVDKSINMVGNAALSGFFSGVNQYLTASAARNLITNNEYEQINTRGLMTQGGFEGTGSAFDMLTDYYIKRAEQIRPVIEVTAGRIVDVTFTCGTDVGDIHVKSNIEVIRNNARR